ncbi:hypothetical protein LSH36_462g02079 [Paralvinella palmiformis]|uniref:PiggyBac transposable element-derived protein domain-containing protein n=1 Tax=Paralvinella palmiformis TaxID=53620 RepID=A0AAD9JB48_9ANNE|nr:hypothetical protein LSH36_462g02079 [Paralvinella palmiformis]
MVGSVIDHGTKEGTFGRILVDTSSDTDSWISRNKILQILRYLHFVNNEDSSINKENKLWKMQNILDYINKRFRTAYHPRRELSIDETMLKFKGSKRIKIAVSKTTQIVLGVGKDYLNKGHRFFTVNYYTSIELMTKLEEQNTLSCGTVNQNRSGLPKDAKKTCPVVKNLKRGDSL